MIVINPSNYPDFRRIRKTTSLKIDADDNRLHMRALIVTENNNDSDAFEQFAVRCDPSCMIVSKIKHTTRNTPLKLSLTPGFYHILRRTNSKIEMVRDRADIDEMPERTAKTIPKFVAAAESSERICRIPNDIDEAILAIHNVYLHSPIACANDISEKIKATLALKYLKLALGSYMHAELKVEDELIQKKIDRDAPKWGKRIAALRNAPVAFGNFDRTEYIFIMAMVSDTFDRSTSIPDF